MDSNLPVRVQYAEDFRRNGDLFSSLNFTTASGNGARFIPVEAFATMGVEAEMPRLTRYNSRTVNTVSGYVHDSAFPLDATSEVLTDLEEAGFSLPAGYTLELGGNAEQEGDTVGNLARLLPVIVVLMVSIIVLTFRSV